MIWKKNSFVLTIILLFVVNSYVIAMELPIIVGQVKEDSNGYLGVNASTVNFTSAGTWNENFHLGSKIEIENNIAYVSAYPNGLLIFDISDPFAVVKKSVIRLGEAIENLHVDNGFVYIADANQDLYIVNATNPNSPFIVTSFLLDVTIACDVFVENEIAFVACRDDGLVFVNVSDPYFPSIINTITGASVNVQSVTVKDNIAYLAMNNHGFMILNVTDPINEEIIFENDDGSTVNQIEVEDDVIYLAKNTDGLAIYNISDISLPIAKGTFDNGGVALDIASKDNLIYVADERDGVDILNVTDEDTLILVSNIETPFDGWVTGIKLNGDYLYFIDAPNGLKGYNIADASNPNEILAYGIVGYAFDLAVSDDIAYISNGNITLSTVDVQNSDNPQGLGQWDGYTFTTQIEYYENHVYVLDMTGILIFDVTNPMFPQLEMNITGMQYANSFCISNDILYVLEDQNLHIMDIGDLTMITCYPTYTDLGVYLRDIQVVNETVYLLDVTKTVHILDASNLNDISVVSSYESLGYVDNMLYYLDLLFLSCYEFLEVIDVSNASNPTYAANFTGLTTSYTEDISSTDDGLLYVALGSEGIKVLDVRNVYDIKQIGSLDAGGTEHFYGLDVIDDTIYIASGYGGLRIALIDSNLDPIPEDPIPTTRDSIIIPGFTILAFTASFTFLAIIVVIRRRRN